ncbi:hypothetical protein [Candidatus Nitrosocosmicus franklandus]|uniref:Cell division protein FtsZ n=1 Tax=Candidatus Nitrosocosmicus franklandianus TaxID=1798806 RepID=A0A484IDY3_9ARCH|nr:hypothetical protein [Candidatus Nitrosocosmicus franklandus]VFJ15351.1 Cell division protein FtsZ [Candidatus Nitrosocosmicus franklandus]
MSFVKKSTRCIVGVGDAGSRITIDVIGQINSDYLLITNNSYKTWNSDRTVKIDFRNIINPSHDLMRKAFLDSADNIIRKIYEYQSVILIGNLASRFGAAILPMLAQMLRTKTNIEIVCVAILPFSFEKEKLFRCGVSLSLLSRYIENIIVIDNDAVLRKNHDIPLDEHLKTTNQAISDIIIESINKTFPIKFNLISTSGIRSPSLKDAFLETFSSLTEKINLSDIQKYSLYLYQPNASISAIKNMVESSNNLLPSAQQELNLMSEKNGQTRCHIMVKTDHSIISLYDPLNLFIPKNNILDFEPEIAMDEVKLNNIRDLESSLLI